MAVKVMRYEIIGWSGDPKDAKARWRILADGCRELVNTVWQEWEVWHVQHGSREIAAKWYADLVAYRRDVAAKLKSKPKLSLLAVPPELAKHTRAVTSRRFGGIHSRVRDLLQQITTKRMTGKDIDGRFNVWLAVLLNRQGRPNCTHDQPIPFDRQNSKLRAVDGGYRLSIRLTRTESADGKTGSIIDEFAIKARGSGAIVARRIASGEYKFCGSSIVYHSKRNKWYVLAAYQMPDKASAGLDAKKIATLHPTRESPWALWIDSRWEWFGGRGEYVASARRRLLTSRWERQEAYRHAGSSNKGHGRKRALQGVEKLSLAWKDFTQTCNHKLTRDVVNFCVERGIGTLVYLQPAADKRNSRFLSRAGKVEGRVDGTGWDWSQVATFLSYKCKEAGIHLIVRKCDASGRKKTPDSGAEKNSRSQTHSGSKSPQGVVATG